MKKIITLIGGTLLVATAITACNEIAEDDRFVPAEIVPQRAILLEEFTGQRCTNCPDGHKEIVNIHQTLGDSVVPVSIHASSLAIAAPNGFKTPDGEEYFKAVGSPAMPTAVVNMQTAPLQIAEWGTTINHLIMTPTPFTVIAKADVSASGDKYDIDVAYSAGEDYTGKLLVWVVENGLIGVQIDHGVTVPDYVHNHVYRATVNGLWGEDITLEKGVPQKKSYSIDLDKSWNPANLYVVAFIYDNSGVRQVTATEQ